MPQPRRHRKRMSIVVDGRSVEVPDAPRGLSASRQSSWAAYWQSPAGAASASDPNHVDAIYRLWTQYADYDRVTAELARRPILSPGSMGQERMSPLAPRQTELLRRIESGERRAGIGGVVNQQRLPEVEVDPNVVAARMFALRDVPNLHRPMLRSEEQLLAEWQRLLAEAEQGQVPGKGWPGWAHWTGATPEKYRLALIDVLLTLINAAAEHGVTWAQTTPGRQAAILGA